MTSRKLKRTTNPNIITFDIPFDVISEILSRLPVNSLLQFRCVCKSWKSLISDPTFARKHLNLSTTLHLLRLSYDGPSSRYILNSYSLQSIFTDTDYDITRFELPPLPPDNMSKGCGYSYYIVGSCDGILCFAIYKFFYDLKPVLWNPSIRKFKKLPLFENPPSLNSLRMTYGFGYDHVSRDYKVVAIYNTGIALNTTKAMVYSLNTDSWRAIQPFPFGFASNATLGRYITGSINWMAYSKLSLKPCIVSLDLGNESYQVISLPPRLEGAPNYLRLCVLRDWLCIIYDHDVWVMKEYGIQESWTILFNVTHLLDPPFKSFTLRDVLYIFQDDQMLLLFRKARERMLIVYNSKNDTSKVSFMLNHMPEMCVESLISPCS